MDGKKLNWEVMPLGEFLARLIPHLILWLLWVPLVLIGIIVGGPALLMGLLAIVAIANSIKIVKAGINEETGKTVANNAYSTILGWRSGRTEPEGPHVVIAFLEKLILVSIQPVEISDEEIELYTGDNIEGTIPVNTMEQPPAWWCRDASGQTLLPKRANMEDEVRRERILDALRQTLKEIVSQEHQKDLFSGYLSRRVNCEMRMQTPAHLDPHYYAPTDYRAGYQLIEAEEINDFYKNYGPRIDQELEKINGPGSRSEIELEYVTDLGPINLEDVDFSSEVEEAKAQTVINQEKMKAVQVIADRTEKIKKQLTDAQYESEQAGDLAASITGASEKLRVNRFHISQSGGGKKVLPVLPLGNLDILGQSQQKKGDK